MWTATLVCLFLIAMLVIVIRRGLQLSSLAKDGIKTTGKVEKKWKNRLSTGTADHRIRYTFIANDGKQYGHTILLSATETNTIQLGDSVDVIYLPLNPKISALASMVEKARDALNKTTTK